MRFINHSLMQMSGWWLSASAVFAAGGACPCCGGGACPVGLGGAGFMGALVALAMRRLRRPKIQVAPNEPEIEAARFADHAFSRQQKNTI